MINDPLFVFMIGLGIFFVIVAYSAYALFTNDYWWDPEDTQHTEDH